MPATMAEIGKILISEDFTYGEKEVVKWQFGLHDPYDFYKELWEAIKYADDSNRYRLSLGFPEEIKAFEAWAYGDLGRRLRAAGLSI